MDKEATAGLISISIYSFGRHLYPRDAFNPGCQLKSRTCHRATVEPLSKAFNPQTAQLCACIGLSLTLDKSACQMNTCI